jgi:succinoglycan biosynthesis transport protein ExoP
MNGQNQGESTERNLSTLRRGLPLVLLTTLVVTAIAVGLSLQQGSLYEASADVFISTRSVDATIGGVPLPTSDPDRLLATQAQIARTDQVADRAVNAAAVPGLTASKLLSDSTVTPSETADILTFTVKNSDPDRTLELTNDYARAYINYRKAQDLGKLKRAAAGLEHQLANLRDVGQADPQIVADIQTRLANVRSAQLAQTGNVTLGQTPTHATKIQPEPARAGFLGGILGIVLGVALVFVRDALNTRVRSTEEVEERLAMPLLGRIPPPSKRLSEMQKLAILEEPHTPAAEAYRMLATNLELLNLDRGASSIMVSSAIHSEGKSTTTANLGVAFARRGLKTVVLEADLRRPSIRKFFDLDPDGPGLADAALGEMGLDEVLCDIPLRHDDDDPSGNGTGETSGALEVMAGGKTPPSPAEFLKSQAVADIIARLTERSDLLLIDTPPLLHVSDALTLMLASRVDAVMLAARLGEVRRQALSETKRILDSAPIVKLGFFATGARAAAGYGGYGYYSYYYSRAAPQSKLGSRIRS